jgi:hypothetical protein
MAVNTPLSGWVNLPPTTEASQALPKIDVSNLAGGIVSHELPIWQLVSSMGNSTNTDSSPSTSGTSWYLGGTSSDWNGAPLALALVLEEDNPQLAQEIGRALFQTALYP